MLQSGSQDPLFCYTLVFMKENLEKLLLPILAAENAELVEIQINGRIGNQTIRVFIDCEGGTTLERCTKINREFSDKLDIEDVIPGKYRIEVSSPGLDRPLKKIQDFSRNLNREVEVVYEDAMELKSFHGKIVDVSNEAVQLQGKKEFMTIPISKIKNGKLNLPW